MTMLASSIEAEADLVSQRDALLHESIGHCRALVRQRGSSFAQGMRLIAEPLRTDTFILYSWLRHADDLADNDSPVAEREKAIHEFWEKSCRALQGDFHTDKDGSSSQLWPALANLSQRRPLPLSLLRAVIDGQLSDLTTHSYETFEALRGYCYNVASSVGLLCIEMWGYDGGDAARLAAEQRGVAFQLTNIVRDVRGDALAGRVYLPASETNGRALSPADVLNGGCNVQRGVTRLIERADRLYESSAALDAMIHAPAQRCLWAMTERYRLLLRKIANDPQAVLHEPLVRLSTTEKCSLLLRAVMR